MDFGAKLKAYRELAGMSQNALARAAGQDPASINRYESGKRSAPGKETVEQICAALNLGGPECDELLVSAGSLPAPYEIVPPHDPTLLTVARALGDPDLDPLDKEELRGVIETLCRRWSPQSSGRA